MKKRNPIAICEHICSYQAYLKFILSSPMQTESHALTRIRRFRCLRIFTEITAEKIFVKSVSTENPEWLFFTTRDYRSEFQDFGVERS